jgi:acyl-coenzyme A thioesterase PaaI-like protein
LKKAAGGAQRWAGHAARSAAVLRGFAILGAAPSGFTTLGLKINFIRALTTTRGQSVRWRKVIHSGKSTAIAEGRMQDADGKLYALCTTTCLLFPTAP